MKNYKMLAPILLIALFVLGVYMCGSNNAKRENQYQQYLKDARAYAEQKIEIYARENYQKALDMRPSIELYTELGNFYHDIMGKRARAIEVGEIMLTKFPKDSRPYEYQLKLFLEDCDYVGFFKLYSTMLGRGLLTEGAKSLYQTVEYKYYEQGQFDEVSIFSSNLAPIRRNENWGYTNSKGKKKIGTIYSQVGAFNNGMAPVVDAEGEAYFIDNNGNKVMSVNVDRQVCSLGVMSSADIYTVYDGKEWFYYKKSGEQLMGGFLQASTFANGLAVAKTNDGWKIYDQDGNPKVGTAYEEILMDEKQMAYRNGRLFVSQGNAYYMIDESGNQIGSESYEEAKIFYDNTYAAVKKNGKWGFIDKDGNWVIDPAYEDARSFVNGFAAVQMGGLWGYINDRNEVCIPCEFHDAKDFSTNQTTLICRNQTWSVLLLYRKNY